MSEEEEYSPSRMPFVWYADSSTDSHLIAFTLRAIPLRLRLSVLMFFLWAVPGSLVPLYSMRLEALGFSRMATALCCATQAVAAVVSSLVAGQIADRWISAEKALALCAFLGGLDLWLLANLQDPVSVFLATLAFWIVCGPTTMLGTTICFAHLPQPAKQFGPIRMWGTVGWMVIGWVIGLWLAAPEWALPLLEYVRPDFPQPRLGDASRLGGIVAMLLAAYCLTLPKTPPQPASPSTSKFAPIRVLELLRTGPFAIYCLCMLGICITMSFSTQNTPLLLAQIGIPPAWVSRVLTVAQTTEVLCLALMPMLLTRLTVRGTMLLGLVSWSAALTVLAIGEPSVLVVASLTLHGLFITGFMIAGQIYVNGHAAEDLRASAQGLLTCINGMGLLIGNLLAGQLRDFTAGKLPPTFAFAACISLGVLLLFVTTFERATPRPAVQRV